MSRGYNGNNDTGLFGALYALGNLFSSGYTSIKDYKRNEENKKKYYSPETNTYIDCKGISRDIKTNEPMRSWINHNGEVVVIDKNGREVRNLTNERFEKQYIEGKNKGLKAVPYGLDKHDDIIREKVCGQRYKDTTSGKLYVVRLLDGHSYYMDIETGYLVSPSDYELRSQYWEKEYNSIFYKDEKYFEDYIIEFNNNQDKIKEKPYSISAQDFHYYKNGDEFNIPDPVFDDEEIKKIVLMFLKTKEDLKK